MNKKFEEIGSLAVESVKSRIMESENTDNKPMLQLHLLKPPATIASIDFKTF